MTAMADLDLLVKSWNGIQPVEEVRETAARFLRVHDLRATDAFQLAAAFLASERQPERSISSSGGIKAAGSRTSPGSGRVARDTFLDPHRLGKCPLLIPA